MIKYSPEGTKIDLHFEFSFLKLGVGFPCEIMVFVATNYEHCKTDPVPFDHRKFEAQINKKLKTTVVLFPAQNEPIQINIVIKTPKGDKSAGYVNFDIFSAINSRNFVFNSNLQKCPDAKAQLSFKFSYLNVRNAGANEPLSVTQKQGQNNTVNSFYSAFNNPLDSSNSSRNKGREINSALNSVQHGRSQSPSNVKLMFNHQTKTDSKLNQTCNSGTRPLEPVRTTTNLNGHTAITPFSSNGVDAGTRRKSDMGSNNSVSRPANIFYPTNQSPSKKPLGRKLVFGNEPSSIADEALSSNVAELENRWNPDVVLDVRKSVEFKPKNFSTKDNYLRPDRTPDKSVQVEKHSRKNSVLGQVNIAIDFEEPKENVSQIQTAQKIDELHKLLVEKNGDIELLGRQIAEKKEEIIKLGKEHSHELSELKSTVEIRENLILDLETENAKIKEKLLHVNARKVDEAKLKEYETEIKELRRKTNITEEELAGKDERILDLKRRLFDVESKVEEGNASADEQVNILSFQLKELRQQQVDLQTEKNREAKQREEELEKGQLEINRLSLLLEETLGELAEVRLKLNNLETENAVVKVDLENQRQVESLQNENKTAKTELMMLKKELNIKQEELRNLRDEHRKEVREWRDKAEKACLSPEQATDASQFNPDKFNVSVMHKNELRKSQLAVDEYELRVISLQTKVDQLSLKIEEYQEQSVPKSEMVNLTVQLNEKEVQLKTQAAKVVKLEQEISEKDIKIQNLKIKRDTLKATQFDSLNGLEQEKQLGSVVNQVPFIDNFEVENKKNNEQQKVIEQLSKDKTHLERQLVSMHAEIAELETKIARQEHNASKVN